MTPALVGYDDVAVPEICRFLGIVIRMYYRDYAPPHFHASYGDYEVTVEIESGVVEGRFPKRALHAVLEWAELNRQGLRDNWQLAADRKPLKGLAPLE